MPFTWRPHKTYDDPRTGLPVVEHEADYVMLHNAGETIYVQRGDIYVGALDKPCPASQVPSWFWDAYRRLTPQARRTVGLKLPEDEVQHIDQLPAEFLATFNSLPEAVKRQLIPRQEMPSEAPRMPQDESWELPILEAKPRTWTCPECAETVTTMQKGVHIARHRRAALAAERKAR